MRFVDAVEHEDVVTMLDVVDPTEVGAVRSALDQVTSDAQRLDLLDGGFTLERVNGLDLGVDDLRLATNDLMPGVAVVTATGGSLHASFDPALFPMGDLLRQSVLQQSDGTMPGVSSTTVDLAATATPAMVATVERSGRWYVSISYTIAEYARHAAGVDLPSGDVIAPLGFDSPEAAATAFYQRLIAADLTGAIATAAPGEGDALRQYASLWVPNAQRVLDEQTAAGLAMTIDGLQFDVTGDGDRRTMIPSAFTLDGTVPAGWRHTMNTVGNPALPTQIVKYDGSGYVLLPPGVEVPPTLDGLEVIPWSTGTDTSLDEPAAETNTTFEQASGAVQPLLLADTSATAAPFAVHVDRSNGCTTFDAAAASLLWVDTMSGATSSGFEVLPSGDVRSCGAATSAAVILLIFRGDLPSLPDVATVEVDGQWYVSPIGTATESVVGLLRDLPDGASLFDSTIGTFLYGTTRSNLEQYLVGAQQEQVPAACSPIVVIADARACQDALWSSSSTLEGTAMSGSGSGSGSAPATEAPPTSVVAASVPTATSVVEASVPPVSAGG